MIVSGSSAIRKAQWSENLRPIHSNATALFDHSRSATHHKGKQRTTNDNTRTNSNMNPPRESAEGEHSEQLQHGD